MTKTDNILRINIVLEPRQFKIAKRVQRRYGLGGKGFSAAIRMLIETGADALLPENNGAHSSETPPASDQ